MGSLQDSSSRADMALVRRAARFALESINMVLLNGGRAQLYVVR